MPVRQRVSRLRTFGPFSLDPITGEMSHNGQRIRLQPQPARILILLTDSPGRLVTRAEIRDSIWGPNVAADVDQSINFAVRHIRSVLRDDADKPKYIETIAKRGYRFISQVSVTEFDEPADETEVLLPRLSSLVDEPTVSPAAAEDILPARTASMETLQSAWRWQLAVMALIVLFLLALYLLRQRRSGSRQNAIVVLPFANLTGDSSVEYISDGITEETITRLAQTDPSHLQVIARTSAMSYKMTRETVQQIGEDLHVQYVVEGSLQREGDRLRVIAQLIRVSDQMHLWARSYDGSSNQLMIIENQIAGAVADTLSLKQRSPAGGSETASSEAYNDFLEGRFSLSQRSRSGFEHALQSFGQAVQVDPKFARAYAGLAVTYDLMGQYSWMRQDEAASQAKAAAEQALSLDDSLSEAHAALAFAQWFYDWDPALAEKEVQRAIALDPNNVDAHHWYSQLLMTEGRDADARRELRAALVLDPKSLILETNLGWIDYSAGRFQDSVSEIQHVLAQNPDFLNAHYKLWWTYSAMHDEPRAWHEFQIVVSTIASPQQLDRTKEAYRAGGYSAALKSLIDSEDWQYSGNYIDGARCMVFAGDQAGALKLLTEGVLHHDGWMIFVTSDPAFASLHSDPAYLRLINTVQSVRPAS